LQALAQLRRRLALDGVHRRAHGRVHRLVRVRVRVRIRVGVRVGVRVRVRVKRLRHERRLHGRPA